MRVLKQLFENNRAWSDKIRGEDPEFFRKLSRQQSPSYLWIGCSDGRVPANQIVGLLPGELFVHRNVANVVAHSDLNCLSVMQFAVDLLKVRHIIVCGHYGCGGVLAALRGDRLGLVDNRLRHVQNVRDKHAAQLATASEALRSDRLCELNVIEQVLHVCQTSIVGDAWKRGQELTVHGWIYGLHDGRLRDLNICITQEQEVAATYTTALETSLDADSSRRAWSAPEQALASAPRRGRESKATGRAEGTEPL
jgi:carbonic anhydrase